MRPQSNRNRSNRLDRKRRKVLQAVGAIGTIGAAGCTGALDGNGEPTNEDADRDDDDGDPNGEDPDGEHEFAEHDHSGEFGASSRLGEESPVDSITVGDLKTAETPLVDVRAYGVVGDGVTDDSAAFQDAIHAATPHGVLYIPASLQVRLEEPVKADFGATAGPHRFAFICHGSISPAAGIGDAITIRNAWQVYGFVRVEGGGKDVETDTAVRIVGGRNQFFEGFGINYAGTVFTVDGAATYSIGFLRTFGCGQALAVYDASPMGEFHDGFDTAPTRAPEFHDTSDIQISQYENFVSEDCEQGLLFDNCLSVFCDKIAVGGTARVPIMEVRETWNSNFSAIHLGGAPNVGAVIEDTRDTRFNILAHINNVGIEYKGGESTRNRFELNALSIEDTAMRIAEDVTDGYHYITGNVAGESAIGIDIQTSEADIRLDSLEITGNDTDLNLPTNNEVHLHNSVIGSIDGTPKTINHVGQERARHDRPDAAEWDVGSVVLFTDTRDGSVGLYYLIDDATWFELDGTLR